MIVGSSMPISVAEERSKSFVSRPVNRIISDPIKHSIVLKDN